MIAATLMGEFTVAIKWSKQADRYIMDNVGKLTFRQIAKDLGVHHATVANRKGWLEQFMEEPLACRFRGQNHYLATCSDHEVALARQLRNEGLTQQAIADKMEVARSTVEGWLNGRWRVSS